MQNSYDNECVYAGFFVRLSAYMIDSLIVGAALLVLRIPLYTFLAFLPEAFKSTEILFSYTIVDIILYCAHAAYFILLTYNTGTAVFPKLFPYYKSVV